jgi:hypothetical protein
VARARERRQAKHAGEPHKTPRWQQALSKGSARTTYLVGLVLSFPGASYLASLTEISRQGLSTAGIVFTVVAVNVVMLVILELPLISFAVAPDWTPTAIERFKSWLAVSGGAALVIGLTIIGILFLLRAGITIA